MKQRILPLPATFLVMTLEFFSQTSPIIVGKWQADKPSRHQNTNS